MSLFELLNLVEQLVGIGVELVPLVLVLLDLLVELVALLAVFLGLIDLLAGLRVEVVAVGCALGGHLVQLVPSVAQLPGAFNELTLRSVLKIVLRKVHVVRLVHRLDIVLFDDFFFRYHFYLSITAPAVASARCRASSRT